MIRVHLEHHDGSVELPIGETVIGRDASCAMSFDDVSVSRRHMRFVRREHELFVEDLGSANGIYVNGHRVNGQARLGDRDEIEFGLRKLTVRLFDDEDADTPTFVQQAIDRDDEDTGKVRRPERRRHERKTVELEVVYSSSELEIEAMSLDLSESGVFVRSQVLEPIGTACTLTMRSEVAPPVNIKGVVRRVVSHHSDQDAPIGLGVEFVGIGYDELALIRKLVRHDSPTSLV